MNVLLKLKRGRAKLLILFSINKLFRCGMLFITLEGPEGSGKSSTLAVLKEWFRTKENIEIIATREPGGSEISEKIRNIILHKEHDNMDPWTEVLLYIASRRQHLVEKIFPKRGTKEIIICDRFSDSTLAYQGYGRKLDVDKINTIQDIVFDNFKPDLTIFFDIEPAKGLKRAKKRTEENNRLDDEKMKFHNLVYNGYLKINKENQERIKVVDARKKFEDVVTEVFQIINEFIIKNQ